MFARPAIFDDTARPRRGWQLRCRHDQLIVAAAISLMLVGLFCSEKITIGEGLGWDGQRYGRLARDLFGEVAENPLSQYHVQRILPSALIHLVLKVGHCPLTNHSVIYAFGLLNVACGAAIAAYWCGIARHLKISTRGKWLGFCALFVNFAVAKQAAYYPVLTDMPAMALGCGMLYFHLTRRSGCLAILTAVGAFTWPTLMAQGLILLLLPRRLDDPTPTLTSRADRSPGKWNYVFATLATFNFVIYCCYSLDTMHVPLCGVITPLENVWPLSLAIAGLFVFGVLLRLSVGPALLGSLRRLVTTQRLYLLGVVALLVTIKLAAAALVARSGSLSNSWYLLGVPIKATAKPGIFLVAHVVYYGPVVLLAVGLWPRVSQAICSCGIGVRLLLALTLLHSIDSESRHLIYAFPIFVPFVIQATEGLGWQRRHYLFLAGLSAAWSKVWFIVNQSPLSENGNLLEQPQQNFTMHYGPFMNNQNYLIQAACALGSAILIYHYCFATARPNAVAATLRDGKQNPLPITTVALR